MATSKQPVKNSNGGKALDGARRQAASPVDGQNRSDFQSPSTSIIPHPALPLSCQSAPMLSSPHSTFRPSLHVTRAFADHPTFPPNDIMPFANHQVHLKQDRSLTIHSSRKQQPSQTKAWQGVNPITARPASSTPNGVEKPLPKLPPTSSDAKSNGDVNTQSHASDRLYYLFANIIVRLRNLSGADWKLAHPPCDRSQATSDKLSICSRGGFQHANKRNRVPTSL